MKGKIIVIEGTDCSGKETQSKLLKDKLEKMGKKVIRFYFPYYESPTGKIIGGPYLGKPEICDSYFPEGSSHVDSYVSCLYYAADRKYNMDNVISSYLDKGYIVILDRYTTSNMAHQGGKIFDKDERFNMYQWIDKLEFWLLKLPKPDITIFLHMPFKYTKELMKNRIYSDDNEKDNEFLKNSEEAYIELSELYNWDTIECVDNDRIKSIETINDEIMEIVKQNGI